MSAIFYSSWMWHSGSLGWATVGASFETCPVEANIHLSALDVSNDAQFAAFQPRFTYAYIETPQTPLIVIGGIAIPNANKLTDNTVWLTTDRLTFQLEANNMTAAAVGLIYDRRPDGVGVFDVERTLGFAVHDDDGRIVGTHKEVQLTGGSVDEDEVQERVLLHAQARARRPLQITPLDLDRLPTGVGVRIDPRTRQPEPLAYA